MPGRKLLSFAVAGSAAAYSAHFVVQQIYYLREKLSPPAIELKIAPDWPGTVPSLPQLEDQPEGHFQNEIRNRAGISPCMEISTFFTHLSDLMNPMVPAKMTISFPLLRWAYAKFRSVVNGFFGYGERIMLAVGISLLAVGLGTGNPGFWIPGCVFAAIGCSQRVKRRD